jgi:hypothetical protein
MYIQVNDTLPLPACLPVCLSVCGCACARARVCVHVEGFSHCQCHKGGETITETIVGLEQRAIC